MKYSEITPHSEMSIIIVLLCFLPVFFLFTYTNYIFVFIYLCSLFCFFAQHFMLTIILYDYSSTAQF